MRRRLKARHRRRGPDHRRRLYGRGERALLCDPRSVRRGRRLHHRARDQPDVRRAGRRSGSPISGSARATPRRRAYVELGPGRGTLAADALRAMRGAGLAPPVDLVETSPVLRAAQAERVPARWHDDLADPAGRRAAARRRQRILRRAAGAAVSTRGPRAARSAMTAASSATGAVETEASPAALAIAADLARRLAAQGGAALIVDYGHDRPGTGDTLQAVSRPRLCRPVRGAGRARPHRPCRFPRACSAARGRRACASSARSPQGAWLDAMGITLRAASLAKRRAGAGRGDRRRPRPADRARPDGPAVQGDGAGRARLARAGGLLTMIAYRDATTDDAPAIDALFRQELHRHLRPSLRPGGSRRLLRRLQPEAWRGELDRSATSPSASPRRTARWPATPRSARSRCRSSRPGRRRSCASSMC